MAQKKVNLILSLATALHKYGASAHHIEAAMIKLARLLGLEGSALSLPTSILISYHSEGTYFHRLQRLQPGGVDLYRLQKVDEVADLIASNEMSVEDANKSLDQIENSKKLYHPLLWILSGALVSGGIGSLLNGQWQDIVCAFVLGLFVGSSYVLCQKSEPWSRVFEFLAGFLAAFFVGVTSQLVQGLNSPVIIISGLIVFIPGLYLTISMSELSTQNLVSGSAKLMGALMILLKLTFGVFLGSKVFSMDIPLLSLNAVDSISFLPSLCAVIVTGWAIAVAFSAHFKDWIWVVLAACVSFFVTSISARVVGAELAVFIGGFIVGMVSNLFARVAKRPALTLQLPGLILIVPGVLSFESLSLFLHHDLISGVDSAVKVLIIFVALVAGLLMGNLVISPRRSY